MLTHCDPVVYRLKNVHALTVERTREQASNGTIQSMDVVFECVLNGLVTTKVPIHLRLGEKSRLVG